MRRSSTLPLEQASTSDDSLDDDDDDESYQSRRFITKAPTGGEETPGTILNTNSFIRTDERRHRVEMCAAKPAARRTPTDSSRNYVIRDSPHPAEHDGAPRAGAESTRASRRAESNAISASDDEKLEMLEDTLIALKTRVAALACLNEDAARETTNAGSE